MKMILIVRMRIKVETIYYLMRMIKRYSLIRANRKKEIKAYWYHFKYIFIPDKETILNFKVNCLLITFFINTLSLQDTFLSFTHWINEFLSFSNVFIFHQNSPACMIIKFYSMLSLVQMYIRSNYNLSFVLN